MAAMTLTEAADHVTGTEPQFALDEATIRGVNYKVFKNTPPHLRAMLHDCKAMHGGGADDYLVFQNERWSYDAFCAETNRIAHAMSDELGIRPGDRVAIAMRNYPELLFLMMAISSIGAVVVFLNGWWTTEELDYALEDSGATTVFADGPRRERLLPLVENRGLRVIGTRDGETHGGLTYSTLRAASTNEAWPEVEIDTDADFAIMYSSGTTGHPKGVVQTHRGAISAVYSWLLTLVIAPLMVEPDPDAEPVEPLKPAVLIVTPLFHVTATHPMFLLSIPMGAKVAVLYKWDAEEAVRVIDEEKITRFLGVPTQSADLRKAALRMGSKLASLQFLGSGGAKRPAPQVAELQDTFPNIAIASGWGMTETNAVGLGIAGPDYNERPGAAGRLYPPLQKLKILDDEGNELPNGEVGELTVKSAANMRCYLNKPEATDEVLQDGWLRTGDLAMVDDEGYVTIVDRKKNIIIRGGENIACLDVEGAIHRHPDVIEAGAFSVPHERLGEVVGAGIQVRPGSQLTGETLREFLAEHIASFKIPDHYWFREHALPRGATDKTDRRALRAECLGD
ncbi:MAG: class I adenylate-forming enzyme family protein [Pseudomonadota bacterium]